MKVLVFDRNWFSKLELERMSNEERLSLATSLKNKGIDQTEILTLEEFQDIFNDKEELEEYIYFVS